MKKSCNYLGVIVLWMCCSFYELNSQPLAFPGAEGFGKYTTGGRGGKVLIVENLNDKGPGSLRAAVSSKGPRIIVFRVSGTIALESPLSINNGDVTIAGQSAPGDGICLKNYPVYVNADNVIIRFIRFRMGDERKQEADALGGNRGNKNIIIDHCSISWSTDECVSFYRVQNFTMQWCLISESLNNSIHSKGEHGYGGIWGGEGASFIYNLLASHKSRNPRFSGSSTTPNSPNELVDFSNNVVYNWQINSAYGGEAGRYNMVNNYFKYGPATREQVKFRIVDPWEPYGKFYVSGNYVFENSKITDNNWAGGVQGKNPKVAFVKDPFPVEKATLFSAEEAFNMVLERAGASLQRDIIDKRIVEEVRTGASASGKNKNGIIDSQSDVGGWPILKSLPAPVDSDNDGMPDEWEIKHNLNPNDATDASDFDLHKEYTNIEVYLNGFITKGERE